MNQTALITGASSGIGKALAFEYAANEFDLILTARDAEALRSVADECRRSYAVDVEVFPADLSDAASTDELAAFAAARDIYTLANNAGSAVKGDFAETDITAEIAMLEVQLAAMLKLTKAVLPKMIAAGEGRIVNVASVYSFSSVPKQAVYGACKSFIMSFSAALANEVRGKGIAVTAVCPGTTRTNFRTRIGITGSDGKAMPAEAVAKAAFEASRAGRAVVVPGFWNKAFAAVSRHLSPSAAAKLVSYINDRRGVNK
jgi:short-subunit dehydrogenase